MTVRQFIPGALLLTLTVAAPAPAQQLRTAADDAWCDEWHSDRDGGWHCEVREITLDAPADRLAVDGRRNGGIRIEGWDRDEVLIRAKVSARARDDADARDLSADIRIETDRGRIAADGPSRRRHESWSVSYRIFVPRNTDLDLEAHNGGIGIEGVRGRIEFRTRNGGIHLRDLAGDVRGRTQNGGVSVELAGESWEGRGLDVRTQNGGVELDIAEGFSAELETGTVNGGMRIDFPVTVQGRIGRRLRTTLGDGGPPVRVETHNGGVVIRRR